MELKGKFKWKKSTIFGRALPTKIYLTFPRPERSVGRGKKIFGHFWSKTAVKTLLIPTVFSSFWDVKKVKKDEEKWKKKQKILCPEHRLGQSRLDNKERKKDAFCI